MASSSEASLRLRAGGEGEGSASSSLNSLRGLGPLPLASRIPRRQSPPGHCVTIRDFTEVESTIRGLVCLASHTEHCAFEVRPHCGPRQHSFLPKAKLQPIV